MKVEMLGSGNITSEHPSSSMIIDNKILIDMPNGIMKEIHKKKIDIRDIEVCLITHFHGDHFLDLPMFLFERTRYLKDEDYVDKSIIIVGPEGIEKITNDLVEIAFKDGKENIIKKLKLKFIEVEDEANIILSKDLMIQSYLVQHVENLNCFGYIVSDGKNKVGFTGDCGLCDNVISIVEGSEKIFVDTSLTEGTGYHMGIDDLFKLADGYKGKEFVATHMRDETRKNLEQRIEERKEKEANNKKEKVNVIIGNEKLKVEL